MKLEKITHMSEFFKAVDSCKGRVELLTDEGDRLNLKSKLTQYLSIGQIFSKAGELNLELVVGEEDDMQKINQYFMEYEK